jgi:hypothetical protein
MLMVVVQSAHLDERHKIPPQQEVDRAAQNL